MVTNGSLEAHKDGHLLNLSFILLNFKRINIIQLKYLISLFYEIRKTNIGPFSVPIHIKYNRNKNSSDSKSERM